MANKALGQNWLTDRGILDHIADLARTENNARICLEIGPGLGTLTSSLLKRFEKVHAVEFDENLAKNLVKSFAGRASLADENSSETSLVVHNDDILTFDFTKINEPFVVTGNIPYYITSPIVEKLIALNNKPEKIVLLMQKEVAERIAAKPGKTTYLSLLVQNSCKVSLDNIVTKKFFMPVPKVDSQIIVLTPLSKPIVPIEILDFIKKSFKYPRKTLLNNLSSYDSEKVKAILGRLNHPVTARPADLSLLDWQTLKNSL